MTTIVALRDVSVGTDSAQYAIYFYNESFGLRSISEWVFQLIIDFCNKISKHPESLFAFVAFFTYLFYWIAMKRYRHVMCWSVLLFIISNSVYFIDSFNSIRQLLAIMLLLVIYTILDSRFTKPCLENNSKNKILLYALIAILVLIACFIHNTCFLIIPFLFLCKLNLSENFVKRAIIGAFIGSFVLSSTGLVNMFTSALSLITFSDIGRYGEYLTESKYVGSFNIVGLIRYLFFPCISCVITYRVLNKSYLARLYFWGVVLLCLMSSLSLISIRICSALTVVELIVIPLAITRARKSDKILLSGYMVAYTLLFAYNLIVQYSIPDELGPYMMSPLFK